MSYFLNLYDQIKLTKQKQPNTNGLRNAQIGAIHAIGRHFSLFEKEAALVVMPTGSGKTAVLALTPFLIEAKRVLILSSSRLVRGQITEDVKTLRTLKKVGVFSDDIDLPNCYEVDSGIYSIDEWNELKNYNFVIGIPKSLTPGFENNVFPPDDLFDLILVDESHHLPAKTWTEITDQFPKSKKVFFTATPFRRDKKEIKGKLIFSYPLSKAFEDGIFGAIGYHAVDAKDLERSAKDELIAKKAEEIFNEDRTAGYDHFLMVRTKHKNHADELKEIYDSKTNLKLKVVHSDHSYSHIKSVISKLRNKQLDGIICVNMLSEGFDFPSLKIAAIHDHHKSLAVTLQFIGRFARTNGPNLGDAKFIAAETDINLGKNQLIYQNGAVWSDIITNLSEDISTEIEENQEFTERFTDKIEEEIPDKKNISLSALKPFSHIKIFKTQSFNINGIISIGEQKIIFHQIDEEDNTSIFITENSSKPKWIDDDEIKDVSYFLYILYYDENKKLLYLHYSGKKTNALYKEILESFGVVNYELIPKKDIHKALIGLKDLSFFNIGLQSRAAQNGESYRIISGSSAHNKVTNSTGRMYSNGHIQGSGTNTNGEQITIGYSSGSKIWQNEYVLIKDFIKFCDQIGSKIISSDTVITNTSIDNLPIPIEIDRIPDDQYPTYAIWNHETFNDNPLTRLSINGQELYNNRLIDLDLTIDYDHRSTENIQFIISGNDFGIPIQYSFSEGYKFPLDDDFKLHVINGSNNSIDLLDYLTNNPITFQLTDLSTLTNGNELLMKSNKVTFDPNRLEIIKWEDYDTDISKEFKNPEAGKRHIHDVLCEILIESNPTILIYDHGSHEMADFIVLREYDTYNQVELYHVKAADNKDTGDRVSYLYEVCGQAVKCLIWTKDKNTLKTKIEDRLKNKDNEVKLLGSDNKIKYGSQDDLDRILSSEQTFRYEIFAVQPGLSQNDISEKLSHLLSSADDYISTNANNELFKVLCSEK
jgi:superfamily II DNA or RNA helicase